jgi:O-antigen/teichoic acid export membrane protein
MEKVNNKKIAKNTLLLYFRMIVVSLVSLFTTRIMLEKLGVENFGIYNLVGGIVGFLGMLNGSMTSATQRFLAFELGSGNVKSYNKVFSMLLTIFIILSLVLLVIALIVGPWLIKDFIVIPDEKRALAIWVYYFSIVTFLISFISIPYMSSIIAHEKMGIYAFMSFIEVILKLVLIYTLCISSFDKLLTYSFLTMSVAIILTTSYSIYCIVKIKGCNYLFFWEKSLFKKLISYISWNLFGSVTSILNYQGQTLILNLFFGPLVNAAKAIADKINSVVGSFSNNFFMAVRPQIIKSYASGDYTNMFKLVNRSSKFSFYLLYLITLPLIILMQKILTLWLGANQVDNNMIVFSQLMLVFSLVNVFESPITTMIQATGDIRKYEIIIGSGVLLVLPICYFLFQLGFPAYYSLIVLILIFIIAHFFRLFIAKKQLGLSINHYLKSVFRPIILSALPTSILGYYLSKYCTDNIFGMFFSLLSCIFSTILFIYILGLNSSEKKSILDFFKSKIKYLF